MRAHVIGGVSRRGTARTAPSMIGCEALLGVTPFARPACDPARLPPERLHLRDGFGLVPGRPASESA